MNPAEPTQSAFVFVCAGCNRIRPLKSRPTVWVVAPAVLQAAGDNLSHGICPDCAERLYGMTLETYVSAYTSETATPIAA